MTNLTSIAAGRYLLVEPLGEGGMATVFRAYDQRLQVWRAVKVLNPEFAHKEKVAKRFESEAQTMALLEHPHIVRVYDVGRDGSNIAFIVMELVEGGCLADWLSSNGPMPARMAVETILQLARGLSGAHAKGVVHRDVKPQNVMVTADGVCRVTDFGIARGMTHDHDTRTGSVMGTWGYMAPEQRTDAKSVDRRSDVYAAGATLYTLLTDRMPMDLFAADRDSSILEGVHPDVVPILIKATEYDREDRFDSMESFALALEGVVDALPEVGPDVEPLALGDAHPLPAPDPALFTPATTIRRPNPDAAPTLLPADELTDVQGPPSEHHLAMTLPPGEVGIQGEVSRQDRATFEPPVGPGYDPATAPIIARIERPHRSDESGGVPIFVWLGGLAVLMLVGGAVAGALLIAPMFLGHDTGEPTAQPSPVPTARPEPGSDDPVPVADPEPIAEPEPVADPEPIARQPNPNPEPVASPSPVVEPVPVEAPSPVQPSVPEPVEAPIPEPVEVPAPQPVEAPAPDPAPVPSPEPAEEPVPVDVPEPVAVEPCVKDQTRIASTGKLVFRAKPCAGLPADQSFSVMLHYRVNGSSFLSRKLAPRGSVWVFGQSFDAGTNVEYYLDGWGDSIGSAGAPKQVDLP